MTVCPALLPPWLRTTMSARAVSTSISCLCPRRPTAFRSKLFLPCEIENGQKIFPTHPAGHSRDLPTDNKLAASRRNTFCNVGASYSLHSELQAGRVTPCAPLWICQLTACRGLPALPQLAASSGSPSRWRRARCFSSGFHHCGPNRAHPLYVCTSRFGGTRRTPLLDRRFSFHGPASFSNSGIRHRSAIDIRLAG